jgi:hypothetical protein
MKILKNILRFDRDSFIRFEKNIIPYKNSCPVKKSKTQLFLNIYVKKVD